MQTQLPSTAKASAEAALEALGACERACRELLAAKDAKSAKRTTPEHVRSLQDCAETCQLATRMLSRRSDFSAEICELVDRICRVSAESCRSIETPASAACAARCEECAEAAHTYFVTSTWDASPVRKPRETRRPIH